MSSAAQRGSRRPGSGSSECPGPAAGNRVQVLRLAKRLLRLSEARRRPPSGFLAGTDDDDAVTVAQRAHLAAVVDDYGHFLADPTTRQAPDESGSVPEAG